MKDTRESITHVSKLASFFDEGLLHSRILSQTLVTAIPQPEQTHSCKSEHPLISSCHYQFFRLWLPYYIGGHCHIQSRREEIRLNCQESE